VFYYRNPEKWRFCLLIIVNILDGNYDEEYDIMEKNLKSEDMGSSLGFSTLVIVFLTNQLTVAKP
jgi:hypothetical protein